MSPTGAVARAREAQAARTNGTEPETLTGFIARMQPEIARALPKGMDADRMARLALTCVRRDPALAACSPASFAGALLTASALGLEPGVSGEAYLVAYKNECTLIVGYQGYAKLFWQHPLAKHIDAQVVYERDTFDYALGLEPRLNHIPARGDRGAPIYYYAVATLTTGAAVFEVMTPEQVAAVRDASPNRRGGIRDPQRWMERKTVLRQLVKRLPRSTTMSSALAADEKSGTVLASHRAPEAIKSGADFGPTGYVDDDTAVVDGDSVNTVTGEVAAGPVVNDDRPTSRSAGDDTVTEEELPPDADESDTVAGSEHARSLQDRAAASWESGS